MDNDPITRSFELAAERCEDLTPMVYARLFHEHPELEPMFILDRNGSARGNMLALGIGSLLDSISDGSYGANVIRTEALNHAGIGVRPEQFTRFFGIIADTVQELLGPDWTDEMATAWKRVLGDLDRIVATAS